MSKSKRKLKRPPVQPPSDAKDENSRALQDPSDKKEPDDDSKLIEAIPQISDAPQPGLIGALAGKRPPKMDNSFIDPDLPHVFKRAAWKHALRYPSAFMLVLLNVATVGSFIERIPKHQIMDPLKEVFFFGVVGFIDVFLLIPVVFEVNKVMTDSEGITLTTLLWKVRLAWNQLISYEQPKFLKFSIIRTKKCFYLLNKYDLKPHFELAAIISAKMLTHTLERQASSSDTMAPLVEDTEG